MSSVLEVAGRWIHVESLSDGVTRIREPDVHEFIQGNIWHIRGRDRDLLVDTGTGVRSLRTEHRASFNRVRMIEIIGDNLAGRRRPGCPDEHGMFNLKGR